MAGPNQKVIVHSCISTELDFDHTKALQTVLQDCTDEQIVAEFAQRKEDQRHKEISNLVDQKYYFEKIIGSGASGVVHLVYHKNTGKGYACKVLAKNKMNDFVSSSTEIKIMKKVKHGNVISLYELFESPKCQWLIMELTNSGGFREILIKQGILPEIMCCKFAMQMLEGVHYLHSEGIVHRDLKVDNILFDGNIQTGKVIIADFGLSALIIPGVGGYHATDSVKRKSFTGMTEPWGTVTHCSPELIFKRAYGPQTDMWSLGCIMYEMLTGHAAFPRVASDRKNKNADLYRKIRGSLYNKERLSAVSSCGREILKMMLEVNPKKRLTASEALLHPWFKKLLLVGIPLGLRAVEVVPTPLVGPNHPIGVSSTYGPEFEMGADMGMIKVTREDTASTNHSHTNLLRKCGLLKASMLKDSIKVKSNPMYVANQAAKDNKKMPEDINQVEIVSERSCFFFSAFSFLWR